MENISFLLAVELDPGPDWEVAAHHHPELQDVVREDLSPLTARHGAGVDQRPVGAVEVPAENREI